MMKLILGVTAAIAVAGVGLLTTTSMSVVEDKACTGKHLLTGLEKSRPELLSAITQRASSLPYGEGLLWRIEAKGVAPSFVFGTMHLSDPRLLDLAPNVKKAFDGSNTLALEITDIVDPKAMEEKMKGLVQYTAYLDGSTISDRLTDDRENTIKTVFNDRSSIPWFLAKRLKPWAMMGAIAAPACEIARKAAGEPFLDQSLAQQAEKSGKKLVSLETMQSQVLAMSSLPEPMMLTALYQTALLGSKLDDVFETMIALYEEEKIGVIWSMIKHVGPEGLKLKADQSEYADFQRVIVDKRNLTMADASEPLIKAGGAFVAVGALHLPGEKGLLNILAQRGYKVVRQ